MENTVHFCFPLKINTPLSIDFSDTSLRRGGTFDQQKFLNDPVDKSSEDLSEGKKQISCIGLEQLCNAASMTELQPLMQA